jgi:hypothetical protein
MEFRPWFCFIDWKFEIDQGAGVCENRKGEVNGWKSLTVKLCKFE